MKLRGAEQRCVALEGDVGGQVSCAIYEPASRRLPPGATGLPGVSPRPARARNPVGFPNPTRCARRWRSTLASARQAPHSGKDPR